jgi:hypothetical protein
VKTDLISQVRQVWAKQWAGLTLFAAVAALGATSVAGAADAGAAQRVKPTKILAKTCASQNSSSGCIAGTNTSTGNGVFGYNSNSGYGVLGESVSSAYAGTGGANFGAGPGVLGISSSGFGVQGYSETGIGVYAESSGASSSVIPLYAYNPSASPQPVIEGYSGIGQVFEVSGYGNMFIPGELYTGGSCSFGCSRTRHVESFGARTSQPTIDDVGESALHDGSAHVALDPAFANAVDAKKQYVVLLTPEGDASLYVAGRGQRSFDVREVGGGRANIPFAYRIVAKPYGVKDERLPMRDDPPRPSIARHPLAR